jgi:4-carboxymuconolactone decarboxylase
MSKREKARQIIAAMIPGWRLDTVDATAPKPFAHELEDLAIDHAYGDLWARDGLDRRVRSMITIAMMVAVRDADEMRIHIPAAIRNGVTLEEIEEILYHASGYVGFPAAAGARNVAVGALTEAGFLP